MSHTLLVSVFRAKRTHRAVLSSPSGQSARLRVLFNPATAHSLNFPVYIRCTEYGTRDRPHITLVFSSTATNLPFVIFMAANVNNATEDRSRIAMDHIAALRADNNTLLLGVDGLLDRVEWSGTNRQGIVVRVGEAEMAKTEDRDIEPAELTMVAIVSPDSFFLTPTGGYSAPTAKGYTTKLVDAKGNALLLQGKPGDLADSVHDFIVHSIEQVDVLRDRADGDSKKIKIGGCYGGGSARGVKVTHAMFEVVDADELKALGKKDLNSKYGSSLLMKDWPTPVYGTARAEMAQLLKARTHRVVPVPAYNKEGDLLAPSQYRSLLAGALVEARFTLSFVYNFSQAAFMYTATLLGMDIIHDAPPQPRLSPFKRKAAVALVSPKKAKKQRTE